MKDPGPGVHVVVHAEPLRAGRAVADAVGGQLITLPAMAEAVVERLSELPAARLLHQRLMRAEELAAPLVGTDPQADRLVVEGADELEHLADRVVLDDALAARLRRQATELAALEALVARTATPDAGGDRPHGQDDAARIRAAAAAVVAEEAAVADARCALALADVLRSVHPPAPVGADPTDEPAEPVEAGPDDPDGLGAEDHDGSHPVEPQGTDGDGHDRADRQPEPVDEAVAGPGVATEPATETDGDAVVVEPGEVGSDTPTEELPTLALDSTPDEPVPAADSTASPSADDVTASLLGVAGSTEDDRDMWGFELEVVEATGDGSVLLPLGIFLVSLVVAFLLSLFGFSIAPIAITIAIGALIAALVRYSITAERTNASHRQEAREALANAVQQSQVPRYDEDPLLGRTADADADDRRADGVDDEDLDDDAPAAPIGVEAEPPEPADPAHDAAPGQDGEDGDGLDLRFPDHDGPIDAERLETRPAPGLEDGPTATVVDDAERARRAQVLADALARLAAARQAWAAVAEPDADPAALEDSLTRPVVLAADAPASPAIRATQMVLAGAREAWQAQWARLGRSAPPPDDAVIELLIADLHETAPDPKEAELALAQRPTLLARQAARAELADLLEGAELDELRAAVADPEVLDEQAVVLVEPFHDLSRRRREGLRARLDVLPDDLTVVVIVQSAKHVPAAASSNR